MENEPGKPGIARVIFFGSVKFLGLNIHAIRREWLPSLGKAYVRLPNLGKVTQPGYYRHYLEITLFCCNFEIGVIHALLGKI